MDSPVQVAENLLHAFWRILQRPDFVIAVLFGAAATIQRWWRKAHRKAMEPVVRSWPSVPASIDVVSSTVRQEPDNKRSYYVAVLSYFYRNPDLQMGEYEREFPLQAIAQRWAAQFKGRTVMVHVNPADPADSVLLAADLEGLTLHSADSIEDAVRTEKTPVLPHAYRFLAAVCQLVSMAGIGLSVAVLFGTIAGSAWALQKTLLWLGLGMLAFTTVAALVVSYQFAHEGKADPFWRSYILWCPQWMRWANQVAAPFWLAIWFLSVIAPALPAVTHVWLLKLAPFVPSFLGIWLFLAEASFHTAILRSQEDPRAWQNALRDP
jgi:hypothetical protein